jgi:HlyD family secretion protein
MRFNAFAFGIGVAAVLAGGCSKPAAPGSAAATAAPAIAAIKPERKAVTRTIELPGTVHAFEETVLHAKVTGYVRGLGPDPDKAARPPHDRAVDIGSRVQAGQVLAELAVPELTEEVKHKAALVKQSEADVQQARQALTAAGAGVDVAKALVAEATAGLAKASAVADRWKSEAERVGKMVGGGVLDTQARDETLSQAKAADAGRAEAAAKVVSTEAAAIKAAADKDKAAADVAAAEARRDAAAIEVRRVAALEEYTRIKAPYDGILTRRAAVTGDLVRGDAPQGLFTIARVDPVRVVVNVPEADAGWVAAGLSVKFAVRGADGAAGTVARTAWSLEPGPRTLRAEVDLANPQARLRPGLYVTAVLSTETPAEWAVPAAAVAKVNDQPVLYLVENGKAVRVQVQLHRGDAQVTQVRRYRKKETDSWTEITGTETVATPAALLTDGQEISLSK